MRFAFAYAALAALGSVEAYQQTNPHDLARNILASRPGRQAQPQTKIKDEAHGKRKVDIASLKHFNSKTQPFFVDGTQIPEVDFDAGESYAGTLPNTPSGPSELFFWFWPSDNPAAGDEITIWLNGGPGCSSLFGFIGENGPILWQPGTFQPIPNPFSWTNLTNVVWIDQPSGTGYSPGPSTVRNEVDVASQFNDFWPRFVDLFDLHNRKVFITGESYAGQYVPYIASAMLDREDPKYFNVKGVQINDPSINVDTVMTEAPSFFALQEFQPIFRLNDTTLQQVETMYEECGYAQFMRDALTFPPKGPLQPPPETEGCGIWDAIVNAAFYVNPCFNMYHLTDFCPYLWDVVGFPSLGGGPNNYFGRTDVQQALHAPPTNFEVCGEFPIFREGDQSPPSALGPLPGVIERTNKTIIGHGALDFLLFANGSLATIQGMTWNGKQGFQQEPTEKFFSPYHFGLGEVANGNAQAPFTQDAGAGFLGVTHTERGLTWVRVDLSGHEIPEYSPGSAYRQLEFLLGRIESLTQQGPFTTQQ